MPAYDPSLFNFGLLAQNPIGQALGSAAPTSSLPGATAMQASALPSAQAQASMQPQAPLVPPQLGPQTMANPLSGLNPMQGTPGNPGNWFSQNQPAMANLGKQLMNTGAGNQGAGMKPLPMATFSPLQMPTSQAVQGNPQAGGWAQMLQNLSQLRNPVR